LPRSLKRLLNFSICNPQTEEDSRAEVGKQGEKLAAAYLRKNGFKILYKNFHPKRGGEIDLVCRDILENTLVFTEVKTRKTGAFGPPRYAATQVQRQRITRGAKEWLRMLDDPRVSYRFDIVEVIMELPPQITLFRNAFEMRDDIYF
jgi:putative endonuclease